MSDIAKPLIDWVGYCKSPTEAQIVAILDELKRGEEYKAERDRLRDAIKTEIRNCEISFHYCETCGRADPQTDDDIYDNLKRALASLPAEAEPEQDKYKADADRLAEVVETNVYFARVIKQAAEEYLSSNGCPPEWWTIPLMHEIKELLGIVTKSDTNAALAQHKEGENG